MRSESRLWKAITGAQGHSTSARTLQCALARISLYWGKKLTLAPPPWSSSVQRESNTHWFINPFTASEPIVAPAPNVTALPSFFATFFPWCDSYISISIQILGLRLDSTTRACAIFVIEGLTCWGGACCGGGACCC